jgi:hypothetical protein
MNRVSGSTRVSGSAATHGATTSAPATGDAATTVQVAGVPIGWTMYLLGRSLGMIHLLLKGMFFKPAVTLQEIQCCSVVNSKFLDSLVSILHTLTAMLRCVKQPSFLYQIYDVTMLLQHQQFHSFLLPNSWQFGFAFQSTPSLLHGRCLCVDYFYFLVIYCVF